MDWGNILSDSLQQALGPTAVVYCLAAIGLNVHFGYTGLLNFGQAAFMMVAGYTMVSFATIFDWSLWAGFGVGIAATVVLALILGVPTLRLRADYLAIVTIAAAEIIRQTWAAASFSDYFGGQDGMLGFIDGFREANPFSGDIGIPGFLTWGSHDFFVMTIGWTLVAVSCLLVWMLMRSPWGRVLKSIREDEDAASALGKNVFAYKLQALALGAALGALAGLFFAFQFSFFSPQDFDPLTTFFAWIIIILGGAGRIWAVPLGAVLFSVIFAGTRFADIPYFDSADQAFLRLILVGLILIALMAFRPQGLLGKREEMILE